MRSIYPILLFTVVFTTSATADTAASTASIFTDGVAAYEKGDFQAAHDTWLAIVEDHGLAADLFYNLGNASQRLELPGEAALWYRRALVLEPRHAESRQNLRVLERENGFLTLERPLIAKVTGYLAHSQLVTLASLGFWALALGLAVPFALGRTRFRRVTVAARAGGGVILALTLAALYLRSDDRALLDRSIVTVPESVARTSPAGESKDVITLPPGTEVDLVAERAAWSYVAIPGELRGWVHSGELSPLWPFDVSFLD